MLTVIIMTDINLVNEPLGSARKVWNGVPPHNQSKGRMANNGKAFCVLLNTNILIDKHNLHYRFWSLAYHFIISIAYFVF